MDPQQSPQQPDEAIRELMRAHRDSQHHQSLSVFITVGLLLVATAGTVGNALVIGFFSRTLKDWPSNVYVIALATIDLLICSLVIPATLYQDVWLGANTDASCKALHLLRSCLIPASACLLCLIAVDRFLLICFVPAVQIQPRGAAFWIAFSVMLGCLAGIPVGLSTGTREAVQLQLFDSGPADPTSSSSAESSPAATTAPPFEAAFYGERCVADSSLIGRGRLAQFKLALSCLFGLSLVTVVAFYARIFTFVRRRQMRWRRASRALRSGSAVSASMATTTVTAASASSRSRRRLSSRLSRRGVGEEATEAKSPVLQAAAAAAMAAAVTVSPEAGRGRLSVPQLGVPPRKSSSWSHMVADQGSAASVAVAVAAAAEKGGAPAAESRSMAALPQAESDCEGEEEEDEFGETVTGLRRPVGRSSGRRSRRRHRRCLDERRRKKPHIKTAKMLAVITVFYVLSYLPFLVVFNKPSIAGAFETEALGDSVASSEAAGASRNSSVSSSSLTAPSWNSTEGLQSADKAAAAAGGSFWRRLRRVLGQTFFYFYFINHGANPVIYGCMNTYFRQHVGAICGSVKRC